MQFDGDVRARQERIRGVSRLQVAIRGSRQHDVADLQARLALGEGQQRPAGTDLDVVWMCADREQGQWPALGCVSDAVAARAGHPSDDAEAGGPKPPGAGKAALSGGVMPDRSGSQIIQGQVPR